MTEAAGAIGEKPGSGVALLTLATVIGGGIAYLLTWVIPREIGFSAYSAFAVFWSALFLTVGGLSGIQQEVTRATSPTTAPTHRKRAGVFALVCAGALFLAIVSTAPLWVDIAFPVGGWALIWPLATGVSSFVLVAVAAGTLYGLREWRRLFWLIVFEALARAVAVLIVVAASDDIVALAWAVAVPWAFALVALWRYLRPGLVGRSEIDVGYGALTWNSARTVVASASAGLMVSGFPLILALTSVDSTTPQILGLYVLAVTFVRAPLVVAAMAAQSYLIVLFRSHADRVTATALRIIGWAVAVAAPLAVAGWFAGPAVFEWLFPGEPLPSSELVSALVGSSLLMAVLFIVAPAALSRGSHTAYVVGWVAAALATIAALVWVPGEIGIRVGVSLLAGPASGLLLLALAALAARVRSNLSTDRG